MGGEGRFTPGVKVTPLCSGSCSALPCVKTSAGLWGELAAVGERGKEILTQVLERLKLNFFGHCLSPTIY